MTRPAVRLDVVAMVRATENAADYVANTIARADAARNDSDRTARREKSLCPCCYYIERSRAGGASITHQPCALCGADQSYGSTATDALCLPCAREHSLCKRCGGDLEMRPRRRKWPNMPKESP